MKQIVLLFNLSLLFFSLSGCSQNEVDRKVLKSSYIAINGSDTAWLNVVIGDASFKGQCEINFHNKYKDSGNIKGMIKGDTLIGDFHYLRYGLEWKRIAIALLRKDDKLIMGKGAQGVYLKIPYFIPEIPIKYDSAKFVFQKIANP
jgi:hypothetical protein